MKRAFTLVEMLVSLTITMIMMGAVATLFGLITDNVSGSRATIELAERLRACRNRLQADLQGITVTMIPPRRPENDEGYLEYIEGPYRDGDFQLPNNNNLQNDTILGDADDVLMFTTRSRAEPFVGKFAGSASTTIESQVAEVMYFAVPNGLQIDPANSVRLYTLYRRVLLVEPGLRANASFPTSPSATYFDANDISVHVESSTGFVVPNGLGDLTKRENRFAHYPTTTSAPYGFPFNLNLNLGPFGTTVANAPNAYLIPLSQAPGSTINNRLGDDVLMTNVLAFDVQIFDPSAQINTAGGSPIAMTPSDAGYNSDAPAGYSGYVDLGYTLPGNYALPSNLSVTLFDSTQQRSVIYGASTYLTPTLPAGLASSLPLTPPIPPVVVNPSPITPTPMRLSYTYDTWSLHYEADGIPQTGAHNADTASNGLDDDGNGLVDDTLELDTQAPFASQLRGIKVTIRAYEPGSQQVRQVTVIQDFLPE